MDDAENLVNPWTNDPRRSLGLESAVRATHVGLVSYPPGSQFGPRRMEEFELIRVLERGARYHCQADTDPSSLLECPSTFNLAPHTEVAHSSAA